MDISKMTPEEKMAMLKALKAEEEANNSERAKYKALVKEVVEKNFKRAQEVSEELSKFKKEVFEDFSTIIEMKAELYKIKENQQSHTFTTDNGLSITIGHRVVDSFDDTVHTGIAKVKGYIQSLASGEKKAEIELMLDLLLKKDKNGNMRANRVLELKKLAEQVNNYDFYDGVKIIEQAYKPAKSSTFVEATYKDEKTGKKVYVPLSVSSVGDKNEG